MGGGGSAPCAPPPRATALFRFNKSKAAIIVLSVEQRSELIIIIVQHIPEYHKYIQFDNSLILQFYLKHCSRQHADSIANSLSCTTYTLLLKD